MKRYLKIFILSAVFFACRPETIETTNNESQRILHSSQGQPDSNDGKLVSDGRFNFHKSSPRDLVALLSSSGNRRSPYNFIMFGSPAPVNWITDKDISFLMPFIRSADTCKCLVSLASSNYCPDCFSTIGGNAVEMITCYRQKKEFPRQLNSCVIADSNTIKDITRWWKFSR